MNNSLDLMRSRLNHEGGAAQQDRMIRDKKESLDKALLYSYQSAKVRKLDSTNEPVRALINPNSVKQDYDDKTISIGYEHGYKPGTVFEWVNTGTKWLIYLQDLTELAYFKGDIRKCNYEIKWKDHCGQEQSTFAAVRGPVETNIESTQSNNIRLDVPNHTLYLMLPADTNTLNYFKRYSKFYLNPLKEGDTPICWRVEATDTISIPGILEITAAEYYINEQQDDVKEGIVDAYGEVIPEPQDSAIEGPIFIKPKLSYVYKYTGNEDGVWAYDTRLPIEVIINEKEITITWKTTYTGEFVLQYVGKDIIIAGKTIVVESLF